MERTTGKKWAVEQKYYSTGKTNATVRPATPGERPRSEEKLNYDYYVDTFDTEAEARQFARDCRNA